MKIELEWYEAEMAAKVGMARAFSSFRAKHDPYKYGLKKDEFGFFEMDIRGAAAECAVAKGLGLYWDGSVDTFHDKADIGESIEVRSVKDTQRQLLVRPNDPVEGRIYVLIVDLWRMGTTPNYVIRGWLPGEECKQDKYETDFGRKDRPPCYGIPAQDLNPIKKLKVSLRVPLLLKHS
jgi:hypothetical protein